MAYRASRPLLLSATALTLSTFGSAAFAQDQEGASAPGTGLGEIIVTARKQSESLLDVPVAVTAIGGEELQRTGVTDLSRIAQLAPQVVLAQADSGTGAAFSIRGLGTSFLDAGFDQSVIVNLDGAQISRGQIVLTAMFDMAQIEVLKGPQALFFGKNSPAGVVSISSANPTDELEGYVRAGYEFEAREKYVEAAIGGPLSDTLKARVAIRGSDMRGWVKNMATPLASPLPPEFATYFPVSGGAGYKWGPGTRDIAGRVTLIWEPSSDFSANLKVMGSKHKDNATTTQQFCDPDISSAPMSAAGPVPDQDCKFDNKIYNPNVPKQYITPEMVDGGFSESGRPYGKVDAMLTTLNMNYDMGDLSLASVSTYLYLKFGQMSNYDFTSYGLATSAIAEKNNVFSQELRLTSSYDGPLNFTLGAYYEKSKRRNSTDSLLVFLGEDPVTGRYDTFKNSNRASGRTLSAFGQLRWNIVEELELAGGVRYTQEKRTQRVVNDYIHTFGQGFPAFGFVPVGEALTASTTTSNYSPEVTLTYKPNPGLMVYAAYKTGYKTGGFPSTNLFVNNPGGVPVSAEAIGGAKFAYDSETAKGFEVGVKARLLNNSLLLQATAYNYKYKDLQQSLFNAATFSYIVTNADAKVRGVELSAAYVPVPGLRLNAAVAYNDAKYTSFDKGGCWTGQTVAQGCVDDPTSLPSRYQDLAGVRLPRAPKWNANAGFVFDTPVSSGWMVGINGDVNYTSGYVTQENQAPFAYQKGFALWNAGVRFYSEDDHYEIAFIGRNLADKRYIQVSSSATFAQTQDNLHAATPRGRELRLQATYRF